MTRFASPRFSALVLRIAIATTLAVSASVDAHAQVARAGRNVNMASGTTLPDGDPWLQRQSELSVACSSRDSLACLAVGNDYRTVDVAGLSGGRVIGDAWLGAFFTVNGGQTWTTTLVPGYPQDQTQIGIDSPVHGFEAAADPTVRAGTNGMLYVSGIAFNRAAVPGSIPPPDRASPQPRRSGVLGLLTRLLTGLLGRPLESGARGTSSNPPAQPPSGSGVAFLARYIDDNNVEAANAQKIRYLDTIVIDNGGSHFIDKPFLAVDIPRAGAATCTIPARANTPAQSFPGGMLHVVYAVFNRSVSNTRLMYAQSSDCGVTWTRGTMIDEGVKISQGASIALDPNTGAINVFWRLFGERNRPDAIYLARSTDGGRTFSRPGIVAAFTAVHPPFDQPTLPSADVPSHRAFRTNTHPTSITDQFGRTYVAFTQRGWGPGANPAIGQLGDARVVITSATCNATCGAWPTPTPVDNHTGRGHQFMPALTLTSGQLALAWQDQRDSYGPKLLPDPNDGFGSFIADAMTLTPFHTSDVRLAFAVPGPTPAFTDLTPGPDQQPTRPSTRVSRYLFGFKPGTNGAPPDIRQLDFNPSNYPLFVDGTAPMIGDFIDVAPTTPFFGTPSGGWVYNVGQPAPLTSVALPAQVMTVWGDNRDVRPPANGDWTQYTPPTYSPPWATSSPACIVGQDGMRNQNPYAAMVTSGFGMAAAGIAKPVNEIQRAFAVTLENSTDTLRSFRITIENQPPSPGKASFLQFPTSGIDDPLTELTVNIPAHTIAARAVFVTAPPSTPFTPITVRGSEIGGTLNSAVVLDHDSTNPPPEDPTLLTAESYDPIISSTIVRVLSPDFLNPDFLNPDFLNPDFLNPDFLNPDFLNPDFLNPDFLNPDFLNPDFLNPDFLNPDFLNATAAGDQVTSVEWTVTNTGNTTASYAFKPVLQITPEEADRFAFLLFVSRIYQTPFVENCQITSRTHTQHLAVIPNPDFLNPDFLNPDFLNPDFLNPDFLNPDFLNSALNSPISSSAGNTTLTIAPAESLRITLLVRHDGSFDGEVATSTTAATLQQAINTADAAACTDGNPATTCAPTTFVPLTIAFEPLDAGLAGTAYSESVSAVGGQQPYSWSALGLPSGLTMNPATGAITGTPTFPGTFNVLVTVVDTFAPLPNSDVQEYALFIADPFAPIVVTHTGDTGPGSLRDAIVQANTTPASVIHFNIPGSGVHTMTPLSPLPAITEPVVIDGTTQPDYSGTPLIELSGASAGPAANGLAIGAGNSSVRGVTINGFSAAGIELSGSGGNIVESNYIGTNAAGTAAVPNNQGIVIVNPSANNTIGGSAPASSNVISGNTNSGIWLQGGGNTGTVIERNIIGLDAAGAAALGNGTDGIRTLNAGAQIYRNYISANNTGISLSNSSSTYSSAIEGNYIGTDITGMLDRGNGIGVAIGSSPGTIVGGTSPGAGNVISGNQTGVYIFAGSHQAIDGLYNALVQGNIIGMDASLSNALGNNVGVRLNNSDNLVGGTSLAAANVIASNNTAGVTIHTPGTVRNRVLGNAILSNGGLGIDLDDDGPTPNDAAPDADAGANNLQNFPTLSSVTQAGLSTTISGSLISTPNTSHTLQFFWGPAGTCDPSGLGEGSNLIGTRVVTTDAAGAANFIYSFNSIPNLSVITATATDSAGNTSEFGPCVAATVVSAVVVTNVSDSGPGSLRNAIQAANATPGVTETITFNIPGPGVRTIIPTTPLPTVSDPVDINGTTQPGYSGLPLIEINGSLAGPAASGLIVTAGASSIRGLIVNRFAVDGIVLQTGGSNVIAANYVGTNAAGAAASGNGGNAITIIDSANNRIGGVNGTTPGGSCTGECNLLVANSASSRSSVSIESNLGPATTNQLLGNFMGIDVTGTIGLAGINDFAVDLSNANGTIIGDGSPAGRNIVGGNNTGIVVSAANVSVRGNYIGINSAGTAPTTHGFGGFNQINGAIVLSGGSNSTVEGNIVSGNEGSAIVFSGVGASGNVVRGNYIGLNAAGNGAIGNGGDGVQLFNTANNNTIGGTTAAHRNVIAANAGAGVSLLGDAGVTNNKVIGNYIGTDAAGAGVFSNVAVGVVIDEASGNFIGGTLAGEGNLIANNGVGVVVMPGSAVNNRILGNSIRANIGAFTSGLAIDLGDDGVTPNDALDADAGPNDLQNFPVLTFANPTLIRGHIASSPSETFTVQFFSNATCDASGFGEGENRLGQLVVSTDGSGVSPTFAFGPPAALPIGSIVTATATSASGNTSEFSACFAVSAADPAILVVTNTNDSGNGSLRQAISDSETLPGPNTITFNIPGPGPHTIAVGSFPLPPITQPITIDGTTQPGYVDEPLIELDGDAVSVSTVPGLAISAGNSTVRGLMINRFPESGIGLTVNGNNTIEGNWIGLAADGVTPRGNGLAGVAVSGTSLNNVIGGSAPAARNVISGNDRGVWLLNGTTGNEVEGNYIGTNKLGTAAVANAIGVLIDSGAGSNTIGGDVPAARNVISGNTDAGIRIDGASSNHVLGNYIGVDASGTGVIPNSTGIDLTGDANHIGGAGTGARNVISGNTGRGIRIVNSVSNTVEGDFIGVNPAGTAAMANKGGGILLQGDTSSTIGGLNALERNVISGNGDDAGPVGAGIEIAGGSEGARIRNNYIGTNAAGNAAIRNRLYGILVTSSNAHIGDDVAGAGNVISGHDDIIGAGIRIIAGIGGTGVEGNYIGTNASGTGAIPNRFGIANTSTAIGVGGADPLARNVISGNLANQIVSGGAGAKLTAIGNYVGLTADGNAVLSSPSTGIQFGSSDNEIIGNVVSGNAGGIRLAGATSSTVAANLIGTNAAGTAALGNTGPGVALDSGAASNTIGGTSEDRNVISGNTAAGISIIGANSNTVSANYIGLNSAGTAALPNSGNGISIDNTSSGTVIGGSTADERNVISANTGVGISVGSAASIKGNYIGTNAAGTADLGNGSHGVSVFGSGITIGSPAAGDRNVISGNGFHGVFIQSTTGVQVDGNFIGTDAAGTSALGNFADGVQISGSTDITIGGFALTSGNVISGNSVGINIPNGAGTNNVIIEGNRIGTNAAGDAGLGNATYGIVVGPNANNVTIGMLDGSSNARNTISGNGATGVLIDRATNVDLNRNRIGTTANGGAALGNTGHGIFVTGPSANVRIGGTISDDSNRIAFNGSVGIAVTANGLGAPTGVNITFNEIFSNGGLGIDLHGAGVTPNDAGDGDSGPNGLQNFPILSAPIAGAPGSVTMSLNSTANTAFTIRIFVNTSCNAAPPDDFGEGEDIRLAQGVTTNGAGNVSLVIGMQLVSGQVLTATATGPEGTSEFSQCVVVP